MALQDQRELDGASAQQNTVYIFKVFCLLKVSEGFPSEHKWRWTRSKVFRQFSIRNKSSTETENNTHPVVFETISASVNTLRNQCLINSSCEEAKYKLKD